MEMYLAGIPRPRAAKFCEREGCKVIRTDPGPQRRVAERAIVWRRRQLQ